MAYRNKEDARANWRKFYYNHREERPKEQKLSYRTFRMAGLKLVAVDGKKVWMPERRG